MVAWKPHGCNGKTEDVGSRASELNPSVQLLSCVWLFAIPWTAARQASLSITNSQSYSNWCPLSRWCHPIISSSVIPFSSHLQSLPASGSFQMSQFFASGGQSTGVSASASFLPMNIQDRFPLGWTGWIPCSPRDSQESPPTPQFKSIHFWRSAFFIVQLSHSYLTTGKTIALTFVGKVMPLLFNMLTKQRDCRE